MKHADIWIILILLVILSVLSISSYSYLLGSAGELAGDLPGIAQAIEEGDWQQARALFAQSQEHWQRVSKIWPMLINHDDMRDVEISFLDMEVLLRQENQERAAREIANMGYYMEHVPNNERFSWQNIL